MLSSRIVLYEKCCLLTSTSYAFGQGLGNYFDSEVLAGDRKRTEVNKKAQGICPWAFKLCNQFDSVRNQFLANRSPETGLKFASCTRLRRNRLAAA